MLVEVLVTTLGLGLSRGRNCLNGLMDCKFRGSGVVVVDPVAIVRIDGRTDGRNVLGL